MIEAATYLAGLLGAFALWTLAIYLLHRLSHWRHRVNPLFRLHRAHHTKPYLRELKTPGWPPAAQYLFWFGDWRASLDVFVNMTVPLLIIVWFAPAYGLPLLAFHYVYEVFLSEDVLDHNPRIRGLVTQVFAWGEFHLHHHVAPRHNYGLLVTFWDHVFGTAQHPPDGHVLHRVLAHARPAASRTAANAARESASAAA
jgi:sterol desaturase/sphingolipid hydroxylase (fatty acid hydroxylase superfamily)